MQSKPTVRTAGSNYQKREVSLATSHRGNWMRATVSASIPLNGEAQHASIGYEGYWHNSGISMTLDELAQFRDAINAVLMEAQGA